MHYWTIDLFPGECGSVDAWYVGSNIHACYSTADWILLAVEVVAEVVTQ